MRKKQFNATIRRCSIWGEATQVLGSCDQFNGRLAQHLLRPRGDAGRDPSCDQKSAVVNEAAQPLNKTLFGKRRHAIATVLLPGLQNAIQLL